jgi:asparagine synthase (glutamine-hydrolysing)
MPGIMGIIGLDDPNRNINTLGQMWKCMVHDTSYSADTYVNEAFGVYVGWVHHQGSFSDCMPVWNEQKTICLIFFGEDFTDPSDLRALQSRGHIFDPQNASYLVHLYEELGQSFFEKLNGWFSGVLLDLRYNKVFLFNDRYGLGRIYCHQANKNFYFASEAKSLLKVLPELRHIDLNSLGEVFSCGCVLQGRTLFSEISLLPPAAMWSFTDPCYITKEQYFVPEHLASRPPLSAGAYYDQLKDTFIRILPRYLRGNTKIGISLTGGLDGRMIMAHANLEPENLPCYTFGSTYHVSADVRIARQVARICRQSHQTIAVDSHFFDEFPALAEKAVYLSDGTMDVSGSVELYVNRAARRIAPIRLTGNYGSELLRGNVAFRPDPVNSLLLAPDFDAYVRSASATYTSELEEPRISFIASKQIPWHHYARFSLELSQLTLRLPFLDNDLVSIAFQAPSFLSESAAPSLRLIAEGNPRLGRLPTDRGISYRPFPILSDLHHQYMEFTRKAEYAYDDGMPHWLARLDHLAAPFHLENLFLGRHKFYHFRVWYRDRLSQYLKDMLLDPKTLGRPYLNPKFLEAMVNAHISGKRNYTLEIHRVLTAELIQRTLMEP